MRGDKSATYGQLIVDGFQNGLSGSTLAGIANGLPEKMAPIPLGQATILHHTLGPRAHLTMGWVKPRRSFQLAVISRVTDPNDCYLFILELVGNR